MLFPTARSLVVRTSNLQKGSDWQSKAISFARGSVGSSGGENTGTKEGLCLGP